MQVRRSARPLAAVAALALGGAGLLAAAPNAAPAVAAGPCAAPGAPLEFAPQQVIDSTRAGGEPMVETAPSGRLLYSAHAGTTHFFAPASADEQTAAFAGNYTGQTYTYYSDDHGRTWQFVPRALPTDGGAPAQGFSDPDFAIDSAGNVFFSEINLANVATSASYDGGKTYQLQNFAGAIMTDRQWMDADRSKEYYFTANSFGGSAGGTNQNPDAILAHYLAKTVDGGKNFTASVPDQQGGDGLGDIQVDKTTGTLYEAHYDSNNNLSMAAFRDARAGTLTATDTNPVATDVRMLAHWPSIDSDSAGNVYIVWDESGAGSRPAGVYYSYSTDGARNWAAPTLVSTGNDHTKIWPWLAVGAPGKVAIAWLEADEALPNNDAQTTGDYGWHIVAAQTLDGLGCDTSTVPGFRSAVATPTAVHTGTICQGGTACQAQAIDRRLGDYFSLDVDTTGAMYVGYSDTSQGGGVALPGFVRQSSGPSFATDPGTDVPEAPYVVLLPLAAAAAAGAVVLARRRRA